MYLDSVLIGSDKIIILYNSHPFTKIYGIVQYTYTRSYTVWTTNIGNILSIFAKYTLMINGHIKIVYIATLVLLEHFIHSLNTIWCVYIISKYPKRIFRSTSARDQDKLVYGAAAFNLPNCPIYGKRITYIHHLPMHGVVREQKVGKHCGNRLYKG